MGKPQETIAFPRLFRDLVILNTVAKAVNCVKYKGLENWAANDFRDEVKKLAESLALM
ncbi:hypothetical protein [Spirulina sp. 06S082]|uniref:hypothetical protein n=1 Tax=Spirulina sp. 06S082 TaxID=3110248 RepID=UPI002B1F4F0E|nr:hypothetical protein [Spirulina sp. 06S082]MEA5471341.1 hypothetical protein [Spirulina sp. 06S082]